MEARTTKQEAAAKALLFPIPEHEGYYASANGRIFSGKRGVFTEMRPMKSRDGHLYVYLYNSGVKKKVWVHRAVLSAYTGVDQKELICRHLDDNPANNTIVNLEWGTRQQNAEDRRKNKGFQIGEQSPSAKLQESQVMEIRRRYSDGEAAIDLSAEYGVSKNAIREIVVGSTWAHLPLIPVKVHHSSRRKTPPTAEHIKKFVDGGKRYAASRKIPRLMVECACGCGEKIETPDSKGRPRKYKHGHNATGHWRWSHA